MTIQSGTRLGPYEIVAPIGAGGMGEVYRAHDTRLGRDVAVKILPAELARNAEFKARFEREAKTISQLSHPHICTLFDVGEAALSGAPAPSPASAAEGRGAPQSTVSYLVMELLEGESLADRVARSALPLAEVLKIGVQIADALDKAHRAGITHRDLKPGNIMITKSGAKLLDFGLAKGGRGVGAAALAGSAAGEAPAATLAKPLTQEGTIIGTFQYMAPEQLEGQDADARTDIFAFGAVLYEMATGRRAFEGKTRTSLIAAIVKENPRPVAELQPLTPPALEHIIAKCLEKDPDDRWQSAHDLAEELKWIGESGSRQAIARRMRPWRFGAVPLVLIITAAIAVIAAVILRDRFVPHRPPTRLVIPLSPDVPLASYGAVNIAISPNGRTIAFVGDRGGTTQLYLRNLGSLDAVAVPGTEGATSPFFSPDSQWIGFAAGRSLQKMLVDGGTPQPICDAAEVRGASWKGDVIAFAMGTSGIWTVPASGGKPRLVARENQLAGEDFLAWPELMPGGEGALFSAFRGARSGIIGISLADGKRVPIVADGACPRFVDGYLFFSRGTSLLAARFDPKRMQITGAPVAVVDSVYTIGPYNGTLYTIGEDGTLVYARGAMSEPRRALVWVDRNGGVAPIPLPLQPYEEPRLSPDGTHIAVAARNTENPDVWNADLARDTLTRVTFDPGEDETAVWSRDGLRIAFAASRSGRPRSIYWRRSDGIGGEEQLLTSAALGGHPHMSDFSPDGQTLAYTNFDPAFAGDIWVMSMLNGISRPFIRTPFNERAPRFSPDGRYVAYTSNESGRDEVYVQSFPGPGGKWQLSNEGGSEVVWSPAGKELFYRNGDRMMVVDVSTSPSFSAGTPRVLFTGRFVPTRRGEAAFDVTRDGRKFLMLQRDQSGPAPLLVVVLDGFSELQRRVQRGAAE